MSQYGNKPFGLRQVRVVSDTGRMKRIWIADSAFSYKQSLRLMAAMMI